MKIQKWFIMIVTVALAVFGLGMGIWTASDPHAMFEIAGLTLDGTGFWLINGLFAARNAAFGILFLVALFFHRNKQVLLTIYIARFALDIFDTLVTATAGMLTLQRFFEQAIFLVPVMLVLFFLATDKSNDGK